MVAAITAGGRASGELARALGTDVKALASLGGKTMLERAVAAAREAGARRVVVVGGEAVRAACAGSVDAVLDASEDGRVNVELALDAAGDQPLLLVASDLPFVAGTGLGDFVRAAAGADVAMALASERAYRTAFPGAPAHVVAFSGERVANGSAFFFGPGVPRTCVAIARRLFAARKSLTGLARLLGPALLVRYLCGALRIEDVERRAKTVLGVRARAVRDCAPGLCYDIDDVADYAYALGRFEGG